MSFEPITLERLLRVPTIYQNPKHQAKYAENRARHVAEVGELVEAVATLADGGHSSLCFAPFENGKGSYACTCSPSKFTKARTIVALVQSGPKHADGTGAK